jgi:hypothetical protein
MRENKKGKGYPKSYSGNSFGVDSKGEKTPN